jgi:2-oxo-4-hydroxy-4-carboxy-5-ureidoimidazoline decarboxylase
MDDLSLATFNAMPPADAVETLRRCCGSTAWCNAMANKRPHSTIAQLHAAADQCFDSLAPDDWLQAFASHPKIGDLKSLRAKYVGNRDWSEGEQSGIGNSDDAVLRRLASANAEYESRFGYIFIVCATGKSAAQMLTILESRLVNRPDRELPVAAAEQRKITHLRLDKLFP